MILILRIYQYIKPIFHQIMLSVFGLTLTCKYQVSCSEYTIGEIRKHGTITGLKKGLSRLSTCIHL